MEYISKKEDLAIDPKVAAPYHVKWKKKKRNQKLKEVKTHYYVSPSCTTH